MRTERQLVRYLENAAGDSFPRCPTRFHSASTPVRYESAPPLLGEHTDEVLREWLGYSADSSPSCEKTPQSRYLFLTFALPTWTIQFIPAKFCRDVRYEIRGQLANRALELEKRGYEIISLNIGNPGLFGFRTPETMRLAMIENLGQAEPYCHQKGIFPAREAVVMQQQIAALPG